MSCYWMNHATQLNYVLKYLFWISLATQLNRQQLVRSQVDDINLAMVKYLYRKDIVNIILHSPIETVN
jgi:hypothetical protein